MYQTEENIDSFPCWSFVSTGFLTCKAKADEFSLVRLLLQVKSSSLDKVLAGKSV